MHGNGNAQTPRTVEITLSAAPAKLSLVPGKTTDVYAYNGTVPGPTLEFNEGDHVIVHFTNNLPVPTTVHMHGLHLPANMDGSPLYPIPAGGKQDYVFTVNRGAAGTYWYHPHLDKATNEQVARGLYGAIIIRAADDPLPKTLAEKTLIIADNRFLEDGSIDIPDPHSAAGNIDFENGREGNTIFVSGQLDPAVTIRSGEVQRWRIINASPARVYRLALRGQSMLQVGTDGGLFEKPVAMKEITLGVGERAEVLVQGAGAPGSSTTLQMLPYDRYVPQTRPSDWNQTRDLLTLQYTDEAPVAPIALPTTLRVVPAIDTTKVFAHRVITLGQGFLDGKLMDMNRVDQTSHLGATEIWEIDNLVGLDHPFHLHGFQFQVLDRNGIPEPYRAWKDTVNVPRHESVRFVVRYTDFAGRWMYHCHILTHEDHGMMGMLELK
jgi:bilirubin oxidase